MRKAMIVCAILPLGLFANDIEALSDILDQTTQIATKTKLNIDFVPGTVTVVTGAQLKSMGITNLAEQNAFDMIVGFDSSVLGLRGSGSMYGSGGNKIKWLINDKPISSELWAPGVYGAGPIAFPLPLDAVDRVEIVRGAGSAIYGGNAIYGVVNIITKKDASGAFVTLSRMETDKFGKAVGAYGHYKKDDFSVQMLASINQNDGWNLNIGSEGNFYDDYNAKHTLGYGPGNLPNANSSDTVMADIKYKDYSFWAYRFKTDNNYAQAGWNPARPLPQDNTSPLQHNTITMVGIQKEFVVFGDTKATARLAYDKYDNVVNSLFFWPASKLTSNTANVDGVKNIDYAEDKRYFDLTLEKKLSGHRLLGGVYFAKTATLTDKVTKNYSGITYSPDTTSTLLDGTHPKRFANAVFVQDELELNDKCTVTLGARKDSFSDTDGMLSPRAALVYRYDDANIFKAQVSRAFRPPSFIEAYNGSTFNGLPIKPEVVDTIELGYVHKTKEVTRKLTLYKSFIKDMITFHDFSYDTMNLKYASIMGAEAEVTRKFENVDVGINIGLYDTKKGETPEYSSNFTAKLEASSFALSARLLANMYMTINPNSQYPTTLWYHYTGQKSRMNNSITVDGAVYTSWTGYAMAKNGNTPAQDYLNITQKVKGLAKNLELDFGVKNAFGKTLEALYMPLNPPNKHDIPYMRQTIWMNANYKF